MEELLLNADQIDKLEASMRQVIREECALLQQHVRIQLSSTLNQVFRDIEELQYKISKLEYDIGVLTAPDEEELGI